jgi:hypothetical protein
MHLSTREVRRNARAWTQPRNGSYALPSMLCSQQLVEDATKPPRLKT